MNAVNLHHHHPYPDDEQSYRHQHDHSRLPISFPQSPRHHEATSPGRIPSHTYLDDCTAQDQISDLEDFSSLGDSYRSRTSARYYRIGPGEDDDVKSLTSWEQHSIATAAIDHDTKSVASLAQHSVGTATTAETSPTKWDDVDDGEPPYEDVIAEVSPTFDLGRSSGFDCFDNLLQLSFFGCMDGIDFRKDSPQIVVKVLATTVDSKVKTIDSESPELVNLEEQLCESSFVGIVYKNDPRSNGEEHIKPGTLVTSIRRCGTRARFVTVPLHSLIELSDILDPGEAVAMVQYFLPAFEALHHGLFPRKARYSPNSLRKQNVLVTGGNRLEAQATVKLALWGGASRVYLLANDRYAYKKKTRISQDERQRRLSNYSYYGDRVVLLDEEQNWLKHIRGSIDVVVDYDFPKNFEIVSASLSRKGRIVCHAPSTSKADNGTISSQLENVQNLSMLYMMSNASLFDLTTLCENNYEEVEEDLLFLFQLLEDRKIRPSVDKYTKRRHISIVQEEIQKNGLVGAIICEPWRT